MNLAGYYQNNLVRFINFIEDETIVPLHWQTARAYEQNKKQALNVSI